MADLFDFGGNPIEPERPAADHIPEPGKMLDPVDPRPWVQPRPDRAAAWDVASFACLCGARDEVREPVGLSVDCWACKAPMARWWPLACPPYVSAREPSGAELIRAALRQN